MVSWFVVWFVVAAPFYIPRGGRRAEPEGTASRSVPHDVRSFHLGQARCYDALSWQARPGRESEGGGYPARGGDPARAGMLGGFFGPSGEDEEVARERYFGMRGSVAEQPALLQRMRSAAGEPPDDARDESRTQKSPR